MGRMHRFLGVAAVAASLAAVSPARAPAARHIDLSPRACGRDLVHTALGRSIEGCPAGASGRLALRILARPAVPAANEVFSTSAILAISDAVVYPNPFNPAFRNTTIAFDLSRDARVEITAYDWGGAFVDRIFTGAGTTGSNAVEWGGQTEDGRKLGNGVYFIRIVVSTDARTESRVLKAVVWNEG